MQGSMRGRRYSTACSEGSVRVSSRVTKLSQICLKPWLAPPVEKQSGNNTGHL